MLFLPFQYWCTNPTFPSPLVRPFSHPCAIHARTWIHFMWEENKEHSNMWKFKKFIIHIFFLQFSSVQFSCSVVSDSVIPHIAAHQAFLSITNSWSLPKPMSIELVTPSIHLILCCPLLLPPILPSIRVFSKESTLHEVAKVLEFQLQHQSFQWTPRTDLL